MPMTQGRRSLSVRRSRAISLVYPEALASLTVVIEGGPFYLNYNKEPQNSIGIYLGLYRIETASRWKPRAPMHMVSSALGSLACRVLVWGLGFGLL